MNSSFLIRYLCLDMFSRVPFLSSHTIFENVTDEKSLQCVCYVLTRIYYVLYFNRCIKLVSETSLLFAIGS